MRSTADTPLGRALRHLGITQNELADRLGILPGSMSRMILHGQAGKNMVLKILEAVPALREIGIDERHILYPDRSPFRHWHPANPGN